MKRPSFIQNCEDLRSDVSFSYPGDHETFVTGAHLGEILGLKKIEVPNDKIFYPLHPERNKECEKEGWLWKDHPKHSLGSHDGWSDKKRPK